MGQFNSREFEWSDVKVKVLGAELTGLRELTYKETQEKDLVYGAGNRAKSIQCGNIKHDGKLGMLKSDFDALQSAAVSAGYASLLRVPSNKINIVCTYKAEGEPVFQTVTIKGVGFTDVEDGMKQGDKFKEISLPFIALDIKIA